MAIYRHVKRGTFYSVLGTLTLSCQEFVAEGEILKVLASEPEGTARIVPDQCDCPASEYFVARGELQSDKILSDGESLIWYASRDNPDENWFRPVNEFNDGRFVRMD